MITVASDTEISEFLGVSEDDPCMYHEVSHAYDAAEWETSYDDELVSMSGDNLQVIHFLYSFLFLWSTVFLVAIPLSPILLLHLSLVVTFSQSQFLFCLCHPVATI